MWWCDVLYANIDMVFFMCIYKIETIIKKRCLLLCRMIVGVISLVLKLVRIRILVVRIMSCLLGSISGLILLHLLHLLHLRHHHHHVLHLHHLLRLSVHIKITALSITHGHLKPL